MKVTNQNWNQPYAPNSCEDGKPGLANTASANALASFDRLSPAQLSRTTRLPMGEAVSALRTNRSLGGRPVTLLLANGPLTEFRKCGSATSFYVQAGSGMSSRFYGPFPIQHLIK